MNILHLVPREVVLTKMARERFAQMDTLGAQPGVRLETWGPGWPNWDPARSAAENVIRWCAPLDRATRPALVVAYGIDPADPLAGCAPRGAPACPVSVCVILQEAYNRPRTDRLVRAMGAQLVVFTYANELPQYAETYTTEGRTCVSVGHAVDLAPYDAPETAPWEHDIDVLIVGNMNADVYPLRVRLAHLAWRELRKRGYRVVWTPHPGYALPPKGAGVVGADYVRLLRRARLVVTCTSRYRYALAKLLEIPLAGAVAVSDLPDERRGFFRRLGLAVEPRMLDREILGAMEGLLDDEDERARVAKGAEDRVRDRCLMSHWAERFLYHARVFLGEQPASPRPEVSEEDRE